LAPNGVFGGVESAELRPIRGWTRLDSGAIGVVLGAVNGQLTRLFAPIGVFDSAESAQWCLISDGRRGSAASLAWWGG
jgi:hypothetical protein